MSYGADVLRTGGDADFTAPAELIGHPARSAMLLALLDGRALPMSMLAAESGVAASTASAHLARLTEGGLLRVTRQGRHRYYELASPDVARALEALAVISPPRPVRSLRAGTRAHALRLARSCYDHLAGRLGVAMLDALLEQDAIAGDGRVLPGQPAGPRRDARYALTPAGRELLARLGVRMQAGRRQEAGYCVDWTEQRHHLSGAAGAGLLARLEELDWVRRGARGVPRALTVTPAGWDGLARHFGLGAAELREAG